MQFKMRLHCRRSFPELTSRPRRRRPSLHLQFILFTHDDAILELTDRSFRDVCDDRQNPDGCPFRATMFTQVRRGGGGPALGASTPASHGRLYGIWQPPALCGASPPS